ncbi:TraR/DksA family transcriptional regulator [Pontixanthobacter gangjinensis]|uniref:TraR/DksA family transcriptional regulator n=1 Tax=Pontixanthobacter gangjinensis TaxID=1028742 RepID=A0A6I4SNG4_9SPHN|nr:TraR/DksA family transcriptional regulator [Pontixanthobacter gangjinensis]MXO57335.1 TraR/DksA family transcriptional regulator [Pontixanthobacter gangjinensis]
MEEYDELGQQLAERLAALVKRAEIIEDDLRQPLNDDWDEQAQELADDEALSGVDEVLRNEIVQIRLALRRIEKGRYGKCTICGKDIGIQRLKARPIATRCIEHAV